MSIFNPFMPVFTIVHTANESPHAVINRSIIQQATVCIEIEHVFHTNMLQNNHACFVRVCYLYMYYLGVRSNLKFRHTS